LLNIYLFWSFIGIYFANPSNYFNLVCINTSTTIKFQLNVLVKYKADIIIVSFSSWYSWQTAHLAWKYNQSLTMLWYFWKANAILRLFVQQCSNVHICLTCTFLSCKPSLSTIFQLYRGGQFYWWWKPEYQEKTTDRPTASHWKTWSHNIVSSIYL
jgi:hypothetical protein